jgi:hypothetical protein
MTGTRPALADAMGLRHSGAGTLGSRLDPFRIMI